MASLVPDYGDSSFESSEDSENDTKESLPAQNAVGRLPPPTFSDKVKNSVFLNPYLEAENAKIAVLEKHVKNMPQDDNDSSNKVSKVCWMFKKGKCNYGKKCRFSHVINGTTENKSKVEEVPEEGEPPPAYEEHSLSGDEGSDEEGKKKRKKRPGLTRGLIPSKKVIKLYKKHKSEGCKS